ncbi:MAG: 16S rRNA (cytidine(1402)-2'-O)-methyltransferase [Clostridia bacterium]|nr:16S rRNA (cytidine(1402)-2'-O)-methyltransferase [Clostridia bacterium]
MSGKLFLVATPIGNLEDITLRAIRVLKEVDIIAAEDTRHSLKLLNHLEITKPLISYHRHNEEVKTDGLINKLLNGENIALITDAGTPAISDPGELIVKKAIENQIEIIPVPGACALINALICSGLDTRSFSFYGFLPLNKKLRAAKFEELKKENKTIIIYEAPHKIATTLSDIYKNMGDVNIVLAREITKIHESFLRGRVSSIIEKIADIKGEMIILIEGNNSIEEESHEELDAQSQYELYKKQGLTKNEIIKKIAKNMGVKKNDIYMQFLNED